MFSHSLLPPTFETLNWIVIAKCKLHSLPNCHIGGSMSKLLYILTTQWVPDPDMSEQIRWINKEMEVFILVIYIFILMVFGIQSRASHMVDKSSTTDPQTQTQIIGF